MNFNFCPSCGRQASIQKLDDTNYECSECGWHFWNNPKATVFVVFTRGNTMLVCERGIDPHKGMYDLPGGFVDFNETVYQAAIREAKEELQIDIAPRDLELLNVYHNHYLPGVNTADVGFLVRNWTGEFVPADDVAAVSWKPFSFVNHPTFCERFYKGLDTLLSDRLGK